MDPAEGEGVVVRSDRGDVKSKRVAICTNGWSPRLLPELSEVLYPVRNGVIATGSSRWFLTLSLVTLVLNAGVSYLLGFDISLGELTITGMGTSGIALASTIVDSMLFCGFVWLLHRSGFRLSGIPVDALAGRRWPALPGMWLPK